VLACVFSLLLTAHISPLEARAAATNSPPAAPPTASASTAPLPALNWIEFHNTHTNQTLELTFRNEAGFIPEAMAQLNEIMGDHRSRTHREMDPQLLVLLVDLAASAGVDPRYEIISAYRSAESNEKMRASGGGQAQKSQHIEGRAIDVRLKGVTTVRLRDLARALSRGGVGYYPKSDFVHVDTARVRYWEG
jgi:uncharacterized protein YcbK (DUF882 family)